MDLGQTLCKVRESGLQASSMQQGTQQNVHLYGIWQMPLSKMTHIRKYIQNNHRKHHVIHGKNAADTIQTQQYQNQVSRQQQQTVCCCSESLRQMESEPRS